jgi:hypothetical protein
VTFALATYARVDGDRELKSTFTIDTTLLAAVVVIVPVGTPLEFSAVAVTGDAARLADVHHSTTMECMLLADGVDDTVIGPGLPDTVAV